MNGYEDILVGYTPPIPWPSFNTFVFLGFVTSFFHFFPWKWLTFRLTPNPLIFVLGWWFQTPDLQAIKIRPPEIQRTPQKKLETSELRNWVTFRGVVARNPSKDLKRSLNPTEFVQQLHLFQGPPDFRPTHRPSSDAKNAPWPMTTMRCLGWKVEAWPWWHGYPLVN